MKIVLKVFGKNKETQESEVFELRIHPDQIACLYKDKYGVSVSIKNGKLYRVDQSIEELQGLL